MLHNASNANRSFPLSFSQRRLWFLEAVDGTGLTFTSRRLFHVSGELSVTALRHAVEFLVRRHEPLRTVFVDAPDSIDGVVQRILPTSMIPIEVEDLSNTVHDQNVLREHWHRVTQRPFDIRSDALLRMNIVQLSSRSFYILISLHEMAADGWAESVFLDELGRAYNAEMSGVDAGFPELPIQYADWAVWQRKRLTSGRLEKLIRWWRGHLEGAPSKIALPFLPNTEIRDRVSRRACMRLPNASMNELHAFARRERCTVYTILMTIYAVVLGQISAQNDLIIGTPEANREQDEMQHVLGFSLNTLALRIKLQGDQSFVSLLHRVRTSLMQAYAHKDIPFELLVNGLQLSREPGELPLAQVCFTYRGPEHGGSLTFHECIVRETPVDLYRSRFALTMGVDERVDQATLWALFDLNLLSESTVSSFLSCFQHTLQKILRSPCERLTEIFHEPCVLDVPRASPTFIGAFSEKSEGSLVGPKLPTSRPTVDQDEAVLCEIIAGLLHVESVDRHANFFDIGGTSLLAMALLTRVRVLLRKDVAIRQFLEHPTLAGLLNNVTKANPIDVREHIDRGDSEDS
jgi:hypothetical protein